MPSSGWSHEAVVGWNYIRPGKLQQNGFIECLSGRMRDS